MTSIIPYPYTYPLEAQFQYTYYVVEGMWYGKAWYVKYINKETQTLTWTSFERKAAFFDKLEEANAVAIEVKKRKIPVRVIEHVEPIIISATYV